jgi:hypothetical protein
MASQRQRRRFREFDDPVALLGRQKSDTFHRVEVQAGELTTPCSTRPGSSLLVKERSFVKRAGRRPCKLCYSDGAGR